MKKIQLLLLGIIFPSFIFAQFFQDVHVQHGLNTYAPGFSSDGVGVSFVDFDNDGNDDLTFATKDGDALIFYRNINGVMTMIPPLVSHTESAKQILWADIDNDGDKDLFVTTHDDGYNRLYENTGNLVMVDITATAGLLVNFSSESNSANFADIDNDGFLDLYIANTDTDASGYTNQMYRNNGDLTFTNITAATDTGDGLSWTLATAFFDMDGDGDEDLYISNDREDYPNSLYKNQGNSNFTDVSASSNSDIVIFAMNAGIGDYDNDGDLDIYVTNLPFGSALLQNDGVGIFTEVAEQAGVKFLGRTGWAGNWFDMDNDLDLDLYVCSNESGDVTRSNLIYENNGDGTFSTPMPNGLPGDNLNSYANAYGDINNDGQLDFVVANAPYSFVSDPSYHRLWENVIPTNNNWIKIDLEGKTSNRDGIGTWVELYTGGNKYLRYKHAGQAYLGQNTDYLHFGLGQNTQVDSIVVRWLSGNTDVVIPLAINSKINIIEGQNNPLANDLIAFTIEPKRNESIFLLEWIAENEETTLFYKIEKSEDGIRYETVATLDSEQQNLSTSYALNDENVLPGKLYYYRLKIIDEEGSYYFSKVVTGQLKTEEAVLVTEVFPNPALDLISFEIIANTNHDGRYEFINNNGQIILSKPLRIESGANKITLPINSVGNGVNFLRIHLENEVIIKRFVKTLE